MCPCMEEGRKDSDWALLSLLCNVLDPVHEEGALPG